MVDAGAGGAARSKQQGSKDGILDWVALLGGCVTRYKMVIEHGSPCDA